MNKLLVLGALFLVSDVGLGVSVSVGTCMEGALQSTGAGIKENAFELCKDASSIGEAKCRSGAFRSGNHAIRTNAKTLCAGVAEGQGVCMAGAFMSSSSAIRKNAADLCK